MTHWIECWNSYWHRPASPVAFRFARAIVALHALWIVLSKPDLAGLREWPAPFWSGVDTGTAWRYLIFDATRPFETGAFAVLSVALVCVATGVLPRLAGVLASLLLYHFAPLQDLPTSGLPPNGGGLTVSVVALLALSIPGNPTRSDPPSGEWRWPLKLAQILLGLSFFFGAYARLSITGPSWYSPSGIASLALLVTTIGVEAPFAQGLIESPLLAGSFGAAWLLSDLTLWTAAFWRRAALTVVPIAVLVNAFVVIALGVVHLSLPLLLLFVDWDRLGWPAQLRAGGRPRHGAS